MKQIYEPMHQKFGEILAQTLNSEHHLSLAKNHAFISELEVWLDILKAKPESKLLQHAVKEYQFALLALMQGAYRHSLMSLRLFTELMLLGIYLSADLVTLREWLEHRSDTKWTTLIDEESGVFSTRFAKAFFPELTPFVGSQRELARKVYRECSEFVHGNMSTPDSIQNLFYDDQLVTLWLAKADAISDVITFALCLRYLRELDDGNLSRVESLTMRRLQHFVEIRMQFGGTVSQ